MGLKELEEITKAYGATLIHRSLYWRPVIEVDGPGPFNVLTDERRPYFSSQDVRRWAEYYGHFICRACPRTITTLWLYSAV